MKEIRVCLECEKVAGKSPAPHFDGNSYLWHLPCRQITMNEIHLLQMLHARCNLGGNVD